MKNVRFTVFAGLLVAGVAAAVSGLAAQTRIDVQRPDRSLMILDGRGSHLGVMVRDLDAGELAGSRSAGGVRIDEVDRGSAAEKAGLKAGDIVVEYDGERVRSARQFTRLVQETPDGRSVKIGILRGGERQTLDATPEAGAFSWNADALRDRFQRDVERGIERAPELRRFFADPPGFTFRFDNLLPGVRLPSRGRLGVTVETLTPQLAEYFGAKDGGALVSSVAEGSAAEKAGLKAGDVITSINGNRVDDPDELVDNLRSAAAGDVTIGIVRDRKASTLKAAIESTQPERLRRPAGPVRRPAAITRPA